MNPSTQNYRGAGSLLTVTAWSNRIRLLVKKRPIGRTRDPSTAPLGFLGTEGTNLYSSVAPEAFISHVFSRELTPPSINAGEPHHRVRAC